MLARALLLLLSLTLSAETFRIVSYNVRYPAEGDGPNLWDKRKDLFVSSVKHLNPDIMGTQELFALQAKYLLEKAPEYDWFGLSRRGNDQDEHMGVFYKPAKFFVLDAGHFWLSESPDTPGSSAWNMSLPRMVTWVLFESKATRRRFYFANTHFAHRREDGVARLNSAKLIAQRLGRVPEHFPIILTGDFNAPADSDVHTLFTKLFDGHFHDAWEHAKERKGPEHTFHGFTGKTDGRRIDWIFTRGLQPLSAETSTFQQDGRYPSDHYPVLTVLDFPQ